jgi:hypothetical protein
MGTNCEIFVQVSFAVPEIVIYIIRGSPTSLPFRQGFHCHQSAGWLRPSCCKSSSLHPQRVRTSSSGMSGTTRCCQTVRQDKPGVRKTRWGGWSAGINALQWSEGTIKVLAHILQYNENRRPHSIMELENHQQIWIVPKGTRSLASIPIHILL